jgi:hypothetical protein
VPSWNSSEYVSSSIDSRRNSPELSDAKGLAESAGDLSSDSSATLSSRGSSSFDSRICTASSLDAWAASKETWRRIFGFGCRGGSFCGE